MCDVLYVHVCFIYTHMHMCICGMYCDYAHCACVVCVLSLCVACLHVGYVCLQFVCLLCVRFDNE